MFKKILQITLLIIVIIEIQRVECRSGEAGVRFGKLPPNCIDVDYHGNCAKRPSFMHDRIAKKPVIKERRMKVI